MKLRSNIVFVITDDLDKLELYTEKWIEFNNNLVDMYKIVLDTEKEKKILKRMLYLLRKNRKTDFIAFCIENHSRTSFQHVMRKVSLDYDIFSEESDEELTELMTEMKKKGVDYKIIEPKFNPD